MKKHTHSQRIPSPAALGSTQRLVDAKGLAGSFLWLGQTSGEASASKQDTLCAVIEVGSINYSLLSPSEQQVIVTAFYQFLMAAETPMQILAQVATKDMKPYLDELRAHQAEPSLHHLITDHLTFIESLSSQRVLFERRFYLVLPSTHETQRWRVVVDQLRQWIRRAQTPPVDILQWLAQQEDQLQLQVDETIRRLSTMGLKARCLTGQQAGTLYHTLLNATSDELVPIPLDWGDPSRAVRSVSWRVAVASQSSEQTYQSSDEEAATNEALPLAASSSPFHHGYYPLATFADRIAPGSVQILPNHVTIDGEFMRTIAIMGYPRYVTPGWMLKLISIHVPMTVSLHIRPRDSLAMMHALNRRLAEFAASAAIDQKRGRIADQERVVAQRDTERLRDRLQQGEDRILEMSCYVSIRGATMREVDARTARILSLLRGHLFVAHPTTWEHEQGIRSCLPEARDWLKRGIQLDAGTVATAFPFGASTLSMLQGVLYGMTSDANLIILDPFSDALENANHIVFAKSGAGKSYACKLQALLNLMKGTGILVIDPENEWEELCEAVGGTSIRFAGGTEHCLNPFDLVPSLDQASARNVLAEKILSLLGLMSLFLADAKELTSQERSLLEKVLYAVYAARGITSDPATHQREPPILAEMVAALRTSRSGADTTHLADRLDRYVTGSLGGLFNGQTNVALDQRWTVFNVRDMEPEMRPLVLYLITDFVWTRMRSEQIRQPRLLYIDEAWTLMQHADGGQFISGIARRARKYYLGLVMITQDVSDFLRHEHGKTVLANASIRLAMKQDDSSIDVIQETFNLSAGERQFLLTCEKGEGLLFARGTHVAMRVYASDLEHRLITTNPREVAQRTAQESSLEARKQQSIRKQKKTGAPLDPSIPAEVNHA